jgi:hypothetical protein
VNKLVKKQCRHYICHATTDLAQREHGIPKGSGKEKEWLALGQGRSSLSQISFPGLGMRMISAEEGVDEGETIGDGGKEEEGGGEGAGGEADDVSGGVGGGPVAGSADEKPVAPAAPVRCGAG